MADMRLFSHGSHQWNILFNRDIHDWEQSIISNFFSLLYTTGTPMAQWRSNKHKKCTVKAYYNILTTQDHTLFPWKNICRSHVPSKVAFFYMECRSWEDLDHGQYEEERMYSDGLVFYV